MEDSHQNEGTSKKKRQIDAVAAIGAEPLIKKPPTKKAKKDPKMLELRRTIQMSCATNDFCTALDAYERMHVAEGVRIESHTFYNLLNLCDGCFTGREIHIGTPKHPTKKTQKEEKIPDSDNKKEGVPKRLVSDKERKDFAYRVKNEMDQLQIPLPETAITPLVRLLCKTGDLQEAEKLIQKAESTQQCKPKLRMYSALICAYCKRKNLQKALELFLHMQSFSRTNKTGTSQIVIEPSEREYCAIMKCASILGDVKVMERILSDLAEEVLVPCSETTNSIIQWFESEHAIRRHDDIEISSVMDGAVNFPKAQAPCLGPLQHNIGVDDKCSISPKWIVNRSEIDTSSGILTSGCLEGCKLRPVTLDQDSWESMIRMNEDIVVKGELEQHAKLTKFAGGGKGKKRMATEDMIEKRKRQWSHFIDFLFKKFGPSASKEMNENPEKCGSNSSKLHIVIDGANIGYYKQNFSKAPKHVDYRQIDKVVKHFQMQGQSALLFLHERHFSRQLMPRWAESIVDEWEKDEILYRTPHGANDDWFWMHAALWCGRGTMIMSNDEMRDHHFQMLAHRSFLRWKERHQVHFDFDSENGKSRQLVLKYPDVYSRRIQRLSSDTLVIPLPKVGDENRFLDGSHQADENAPSNETYICIKLKLS